MSECAKYLLRLSVESPAPDPPPVVNLFPVKEQPSRIIGGPDGAEDATIQSIQKYVSSWAHLSIVDALVSTTMANKMGTIHTSDNSGTAS